MILALAVAFLTASYLITGWMGTRRLENERSALEKGHKPTVSVIVAAYESEGTIGKTLESVRKLSYRVKETIVVNDSRDRTPSIARKHGARVIQNKRRMGKPAALNRAARSAKGELLLFLDADTTLDRDSVKRMVPWFSRPSVSAVMPKYLLANPGRLSRLASMENLFTFALIRIHVLMGSLVGMRGCSVMIRKSVIDKHPWPETLLEDNYLSAILAYRGHRIIWEPSAVAYTEEPADMGSLIRQKTRWGEGAFLAFRDHWRFYLRSPQFMAFFYPYMALGIVTGLLGLATLYYGIALPAMAGLLGAELFLFLPAMYVHSLIFLYIGGRRFAPIDTLVFMLAYFPLLEICYARGVIHGILRRKRNRPDLHFRTW